MIPHFPFSTLGSSHPSIISWRVGTKLGFNTRPLEHDDSSHFSPISYSTVTKLHMTPGVFFDGNLLGTPPSSAQI